MIGTCESLSSRAGDPVSGIRVPAGRAVRTATACAAALAKFEREVDPEGVLAPEERRRRAEHARKAHLARISLRSAKVRKIRALAGRVERGHIGELLGRSRDSGARAAVKNVGSVAGIVPPRLTPIRRRIHPGTSCVLDRPPRMGCFSPLASSSSPSGALGYGTKPGWAGVMSSHKCWGGIPSGISAAETPRYLFDANGRLSER